MEPLVARALLSFPNSGMSRPDARAVSPRLMGPRTVFHFRGGPTRAQLGTKRTLLRARRRRVGERAGVVAPCTTTPPSRPSSCAANSYEPETERKKPACAEPGASARAGWTSALDTKHARNRGTNAARNASEPPAILGAQLRSGLPGAREQESAAPHHPHAETSTHRVIEPEHAGHEAIVTAQVLDGK